MVATQLEVNCFLMKCIKHLQTQRCIMLWKHSTICVAPCGDVHAWRYCKSTRASKWCVFPWTYLPKLILIIKCNNIRQLMKALTVVGINAIYADERACLTSIEQGWTAHGEVVVHWQTEISNACELHWDGACEKVSWNRECIQLLQGTILCWDWACQVVERRIYDEEGCQQRQRDRTGSRKSVIAKLQVAEMP